MILVNAPGYNTGAGLTQRMTSEHGLVEVGVYPVLYGSRIRAGFVGDDKCEIDWCCGDSQKHLDSHYIAVCLYLMRRDEKYNCFDGLPKMSRIKPCWLDDEFGKKLTQAMMTVLCVSIQENEISNDN